MYPNTFAGLVQAAVDAGVPGQAIEEMEARGVSSLETARQALDRGLVSEQLQAYLQALVATAFAFGQQNRSRGAVRTRRDLPVLRHSSGGSMQKALAAALPQNREAALREFRNDIWARSNTRSQDSRWKSWCKICWEWNVSPLPLTPEVIEKVSASLKAGGYKSVRQFFSRARREHIVSTCLQVPPEVELSMKDAVRSLERGLGGPALKEAFRREDIKLAVKSRDECGVAALIALGIWFLLRELEIAALRVRDIVIDIDQKTVSLTLSASKTDTVGNSVVRTHKCYCSFVDKGMCPYHASLKFLPHMPKDPAPPLFSSGAGQPLAKQEVINIIRSVLHENKIPLTKPGVAGAPCRQRFHGHCLRVSGAQMLCRFGVPLSTIMLLGRWGSKAIERYVQDAELDNFNIVKRQRTAVDLEERIKELAAKVEALQIRPPLVVAKKAHARDEGEAHKLPLLWKTRCGWPYGGSHFLRASEQGETPLCKRCFPHQAELDTPSSDESETSSESVASSESEAS